MQYFLQTPGLLAPKYTDTLPMKGHSITMILINVASRIREAIQDECLTRQIDESISCLEKDFLHPEFKALLETVGPGKGSKHKRTGAEDSGLVMGVGLG